MSKAFFSEDHVKQKPGLVGLLKTLWPYLMRQKKKLFIFIFSAVALAFVGRLLPTTLGYAIDEGLLKGDMQIVTYCAVVFLLLEIFRAGFMFLNEFYLNNLGNRVLFEVREKLTAHVQSLPIPFFDKNPTGRIVTRMTNDVWAMGELFGQGAVLTNSLNLLVILFFMLQVSVKLTLAAVLVAPPLLYIAYWLSQKVRIVLRESKKRLAIINAFVAENINGMKVLQLYNSTKKNYRRFEKLSNDYRNQQLKAVKLYALLWPTINFFRASVLAVALYYGGFLRAENAISVGGLIAFFMHVQDFFPPLRQILERYQRFQESLTGAERVFTLLAEKSENLSGKKFGKGKIRGEIEIKNLSFRYGPSLPYVLIDINLHIRAGERIAIVGRTGSGKSTLISLLQGLHNYEVGEMTLDHLPLKSIARKELRRRVGVVQQDNFMFRGTIASNIHLNNPQISKQQLIKATQMAHVQGLLESHEGGLEANVAERGANLSIGERQLIAFARILAFDPDVLILDEATANIDSYSESLIQKATEEVTQGRTSIIIAHRLSTILDCDRIVVLKDGKIKEIGNHNELLEKHEVYYQLYNSQFQDYPSEV